jgi:Ni,Fe-hydrogenase III large subunit/Ni,Fe-hydrogenase III component G
MDFQNIIDELSVSFPGGIYKSNLYNTNELYIEINPDNIPDICRYVYGPLQGSLVSLFAADERLISGRYAIYHVFALKDRQLFVILKSSIDETKPEFKSITKDIHQAHLYEREIRDMFGLEPVGHPDSRRFVFHGNWPDNTYPLRKDFDGSKKPRFVNKKQEFLKVQGGGVYEIPVGPVHAGIIEPGHFRFSTAGEPIINLEAQLYYVHRGIEKISEGVSIEKCFYISERISGDETFANSLAYCQAIEKIAGARLPERASQSRVVFAELERLISHLGDLAGICVDVAYGFAASQFNMLRGFAYQVVEEICGSRFMRSVNKPGGMRKDFLEGNEKKVMDLMDRVRKELEDTSNIVKSNSLFIDRVENTGILKNSIAVDTNASGPAGRGSGIDYDVRRDFPYEAYKGLSFSVPVYSGGDVSCRMNVKLEECFESIGIIRKVIESLKSGEVHTPVGNVEPYRFALGYTESPRGENMHYVMTGENNTIFRYKVRTPSFCNWPALCHAVKGNIVPDFPLINKSFNLSYAGNDL